MYGINSEDSLDLNQSEASKRIPVETTSSDIQVEGSCCEVATEARRWPENTDAPRK